MGTVDGSTDRSDAWVHRFELGLGRGHGTPRNARDAVADCLRADQVQEGCISVAALGTSELVTNAILHGTPPSALALFTTDGLFRVEVRDANPCPAPEPRTSGHGEGGRGLLLVAELATRWGWNSRSSDKIVWFEGLAELE